MADTEQEKKNRTRAGHGGGGHTASHEEHEGAPEWLISFADNVTLMMGFFVIMLAMAMKPVITAVGAGGSGEGGGSPSARELDTVLAIREAFNNPVNPDSTDPREAALIRRLLTRNNRHGGGNGRFSRASQYTTDRDIQKDYYKNLGGMVPFERGSGHLNEAARKLITGIAENFKGLALTIEIRGHASSREAFQDKQKGMSLGFERALAVAEAMTEEGFDWRQLRIISCGDNDRRQDVAYDEAGQQQNERVDIIVTDEPLTRNQPASRPES